MLTRRFSRFTLTFALVLVALVCGAHLLYAQAAATAATPPAPPSGFADQWGVSFLWAYFSSAAIQWVKDNKAITAFSSETSLLAQRAVAALVSGGAALGVHYSYNAATGQLAVSGLLWSSVSVAAAAIVRQFVMQEVLYKAALKPVPAVVAVAAPAK